jgi:hypothetical protein
MYTFQTRLPFIIWFALLTQLANAIQQSDTLTNKNKRPVDENELIIDWESLFAYIDGLDLTDEEWLLLNDQLLERAENPLNLNVASDEQLMNLPFITSDQAANLSYYLYQNGPIKDKAELALVEGFEPSLIEKISPFIAIEAIAEQRTNFYALKKNLKYGKQNIRMATGYTLQKTMQQSTGTDLNLLAKNSPLTAAISYKYNYKNQYKWGINVQKDAEEAWLTKNNLPDYTSAYLLLKDLHWIKTIVLGDFQLQFGQGLVCNQTFKIGKTFAGINPEKVGSAITQHSSMAESGFMRGMAVEWDLTTKAMKKKRQSVRSITFISNKYEDANCTGDTVSSILETGLHRTTNEIENQKALNVLSTGIHLMVSNEYLQMGLSILKWLLNKELVPAYTFYNQFALKGRQGLSSGFNFRTRLGSINWFGEFGLDRLLHRSIIVGLNCKPWSTVTLSILGRDYGNSYQSLFASAFGENKSVRNERGLYCASEWSALKNMSITGYYDVFSFPTASYRSDFPMWGMTAGLMFLQSFSSNTSIRFTLKEKFYTDNQTFLIKKNNVQIRYRWEVERWTLQTLINLNLLAETNSKTKEKGFSLSQSICFQTNNKRWKIQGMVTQFDAPEYETRLYIYEPSLAGNYSMPMLCGIGTRTVSVIEYHPSKFISLNFQFGNSSNLYQNSEKLTCNYICQKRTFFIQSLMQLRF